MINKCVLPMSEKFNQLIKLFIAEEQDKAKELFHELVVDKSREIYENLIDEKDLEDVTETEEDDNDEVSEETGNEVEESEFDEDLPTDGLGGDAADDMINDITADEEGLAVEADEEEDLEDRVVDLEDALDELKAEFEQIMAGEEGEEELELEPELDGEEELELEPELDGDEEELELEPELDGDEEELEDSVDPNIVREYTEKAPAPVTTEEGDGSAGPVAGKNDMGGSAQNIVSGSNEEKGRTAPTVTTQTTSTPEDRKGKQVPAPKPVTKSSEGKSASPVRKT